MRTNPLWPGLQKSKKLFNRVFLRISTILSYKNLFIIYLSLLWSIKDINHAKNLYYYRIHRISLPCAITYRLLIWLFCFIYLLSFPFLHPLLRKLFPKMLKHNLDWAQSRSSQSEWFFFFLWIIVLTAVPTGIFYFLFLTR